MRLLLDTHILIWAAGDSGRLPDRLRALISDEQNELLFSPASLWEIVIKQAQSRPDFRADPAMLRERLLQNGYIELPINGEHTLAIAELPPIHKDPFDRILIAQSKIERIPLVTVDRAVLQYPGLMEF